MLKLFRRRERAAVVPLDAYDVQELAGLVGVWVTPESEGQAPQVALEFCNQQKRYARVWLRTPETVDWGWVLNDKAVCLWRDKDEIASRSGEHGSGPTTPV